MPYNTRKETSLAETQHNPNRNESTEILDEAAQCRDYSPTTDDERKPPIWLHLLEYQIRCFKYMRTLPARRRIMKEHTKF